MKSRGALSNAQVEAFKGGARYESGKNKGQVKPQDFLWCSEAAGFGIRLGMKSGTRTYILQYRVKGSDRDKVMTIGRHGEPLLVNGKVVPLEVNRARAKALELKAKMRLGIDPVEEEKQKREEAARQSEAEKAYATTLREVLEHYLIHHRTKHGPLRPKTQADYRYHCEKNLTDWLDEPVATITRDKCLAKFTEITERGAPIQANLCMDYLRALLNHAREMHATDDGDYPILAVNPVSRLYKLRRKNPEKARDTRIPLNKVGAVWLELQRRRAEARTIDNRTAVDWACFILLTGTRLTESASLKWPDVDLDARTITLRGDIVKNWNGVTLPMSSVLHDILAARKSPPAENEKSARRRRVQRASEYVFASYGQKTPHITSAPATFKAISKIAGMPISRHDCRRTFEDIATECKIDSDQRRLLINHISGDVHAMHYANNRAALAGAVEAIATWVTTQAKIAAGANVVSLPGTSRFKTG